MKVVDGVDTWVLDRFTLSMKNIQIWIENRPHSDLHIHELYGRSLSSKAQDMFRFNWRQRRVLRKMIDEKRKKMPQETDHLLKWLSEN